MNLGPYSLTLPTVPALLGLAVAALVTLSTKISAPASVRRVVAFLLALLAGVLPTVIYQPGSSVQAYAGAVLAAWLVAVVTHASGILDSLDNATGNVGIGPSTAAVPAGGTPMGANVTLDPEPVDPGTVEPVTSDVTDPAGTPMGAYAAQDAAAATPAPVLEQTVQAPAPVPANASFGTPLH